MGTFMTNVEWGRPFRARPRNTIFSFSSPLALSSRAVTSAETITRSLRLNIVTLSTWVPAVGTAVRKISTGHVRSICMDSPSGFQK